MSEKGTDVATTTDLAPVNALMEMAMSKDVDVEKLERLIALQERGMERDARIAFVRALSAFRDECPPIPRTKENRQFKTVNRAGVTVPSKYAPLEVIDSVASPFARKHGLIWTWDTVTTDTQMHITCKLLHVDGHSETTTVTMPLESTAKGGASPQQKYAITQSYGMRYSLIGVTGLTTASDDEDGNDPDSTETIDQSQLSDLVSLMSEVFGTDPEVFATRKANYLKWLGCELSEITTAKYGEAVNALEAKR